MAYREEQSAREARRLNLETELHELDDRARELPYLALKRGDLQRELATLNALDAKPASPWHRLLRQRLALIPILALVLVSLALGSFWFVTHRIGAVGESPQNAQNVSPPILPRSDDFGDVGLQARAPSTSISAISLDFVGSGESLEPNESAGFVPFANWNELRGENGSTRHLSDAVGAQLFETTVTWRSGTEWNTPTKKTDGNSRMISGYIVQNGEPDAPGTVDVSVFNLPIGLIANGYAVIVYSDEVGNPEDQVTCIRLTMRSVSRMFCLRDATSRDYPMRESPSGYVVATATSDEGMSTPKANCAIFENLAMGGFSIEVKTGLRASNNTGGFLRSPVNGIQIVPMASLPDVNEN